ncbi:ATPase, F0 complex, subunit A, partial [Corchorus capsularis]
MAWLVDKRPILGRREGSAIIAVRNPQTIPTDGQNFFEYVLEFIRDVSKTQIGEEYGPW